MKSSIYNLIHKKDFNGIREALSQNPKLANKGIPYSRFNQAKAHPLHRICDRVFEKKLTGEEAVEMAKIFLEYGAKVNGNESKPGEDTPLLAAASLHADKVALLMIDRGADIHHAGCHGGTALHWAAWCGRDVLVRRLLEEGADVNRRCIDFQSTPLFWAVHGLKNGGEKNRHHQVDCVRMLIVRGADKSIDNKEGVTVFDLLDEDDDVLLEILG